MRLVESELPNVDLILYKNPEIKPKQCHQNVTFIMNDLYQVTANNKQFLQESFTNFNTLYVAILTFDYFFFPHGNFIVT